MSSESIPGASFVVPGVLAIGPGAIPTTRIPVGPHSSAKLRVSESTEAEGGEKAKEKMFQNQVLVCVRN